MDGKFSLGDLLALELHNYVDACSEIVDRAQKELNIEKQLKKIEENWQALDLLFSPYQDTDIMALMVSGCSLVHSPTHTHTHTHTHTRAHTHTLTHTHARTHTHTITHTLKIQTRTAAHMHALTASIPIPSFTFCVMVVSQPMCRCSHSQKFPLMRPPACPPTEVPSHT